uniref:Aminotransferase-like plant mobile domain-containing protein n=1 Tax=Fagus sylvatica TaxID=28930 RepID=A0A2N9GUV5_FAGSY
MVPRELWCLPRGGLILPRQQLLESSSVSVRVSFLTRFSRAVLEVFRNSKWVMQHIVGKLSTSSFQRYKVCVNRSSDEGVMAPGSRGVGAVFVHFSDEDSGQTGDAIGEPRVPRRSWSHYLSNAPGLADQLVASRKDSAREGGFPDVGFRRSWYRRKACVAYFCKVPDLRKSELGLVRYGPANRGHRGVFGPFEGNFPIRIPARPRYVANRGRRNVPMPRGHLLTEIPSEELFSSVLAIILYFLSVLTRKVLEALDILYIHEVVSSSQFLVWSTVRSNLGQTWSTLVKLGRIWSKLSKLLEMYPGLHFKGFWAHGGTPIDDQPLPIRPRGKYLSIPTFLFRFERCKSGGSTVWNLSPNRLRGDLTWGLPKLQIGWFNGLESQSKQVEGCKSGGSTVWNLSPNRLRGDLTWGLPKLQIGWFNGLESQSKQMSDRGSGSGGHRRSDRLAKGKAVMYAPESSPDTDDEYDAMEDVRTRFDASIARNLQAELDAEAAGPASSATRPPPRPGVVIGRSARPSERRLVLLHSLVSPLVLAIFLPSAALVVVPYIQDLDILPRVALDILPRVAFDRVTLFTVEISDTPPSDEPPCSSVFSGPSLPGTFIPSYEPPESVGRGGWSEFSRLLAASRPEYREFLTELGFGPFLGIPYVSVYHPAVWCFIERFFHHTGTFHLSTCEMAVLPVDWSAILGIRFGGRAPPSEPVDGLEAREILGLADRDAIEGSRRIRHLADVLRRDREEPPTELRYRQWAAYFIFSCFLGNDRSTVPTPIVGMFRDIDALREYDWGTLTYGFYIRGLRRYSRRESISFLGFWQFTVFWAFEHFPTFAPSRLPLASDPDFPLARRWDSSRIERMTARTLLELRMTVDCIRDAEIVFQPYSGALTQRPELGDEAIVPVDPSPLMTIEDYIPRAPSDPYVVGVSAYPSLVREDVPYQEWFDRVSLGSLMSLHEVEGGRVMGGVAMDSHLLRSSGQIERLEGEILRLQLELSVSVDRHAADMDRAQEETTRVQAELTQAQGEMAQMQTALTQSQRDLGSRDAEVARLTAAVQRLEEQLHSMGITPVTGAGPSGFGQTSSPPPTDPVTRDWFFDDPPST